MEKKKGFTLAEALVTIGIIGLISAIVIPTFIKNTTQQEMVARVMTSYNSLQTAYEQVKMDQKNRPPQFWDDDVLDLFKAQMGATSATFSAYATFDKTSAGTASAANAIELKNGSVVTYVVGSATCTSATGGRTCGTFYVDVNGSQKPNIAGVDVFAFSMTKNGIVPEGSGDDSLLGANCPTVGESCTAHVVANNNLSYLEGAAPGDTPNTPGTPENEGGSGSDGSGSDGSGSDGSGSDGSGSDGSGSDGSGSDGSGSSTPSSGGDEDSSIDPTMEQLCQIYGCDFDAQCATVLPEICGNTGSDGSGSDGSGSGY